MRAGPPSRGRRRLAGNSGESPFRETGMGMPSPRIGDDGQLQRGNRAEIQVEIFHLAGRARWTEGVLLPQDIAGRAATIGRPAQGKLLGPLGGRLIEAEQNAPELLRLMEQDADALGTGLRRSPPGLTVREQGAF